MMWAAETAINTAAARPRTAVTMAVPKAARRAPRSSTSRPRSSTARTTLRHGGLRRHLENSRVKPSPRLLGVQQPVEPLHIPQRQGHSERDRPIRYADQPRQAADRRPGRRAQGRGAECHLEGQALQRFRVELRKVIRATEGAVVELDDVRRHQYREILPARPPRRNSRTHRSKRRPRTGGRSCMAPVSISRRFAKCRPDLLLDERRFDPVGDNFGLHPGTEQRLPRPTPGRAPVRRIFGKTSDTPSIVPAPGGPPRSGHPGRDRAAAQRDRGPRFAAPPRSGRTERPG